MQRIKVESLSFSTVNGYEMCSESQWLRKIEHEPTSQMSSNLVNGIALHAAAQSWFLSLKAKAPLTLDELKRVYFITFDRVAKSVPKVEYGTKSYDEITQNSIQLIELLMEQEVGEVLATEFPVKYQMVEGLGFLGQIDLISRLDNGQLVVWDLKSSSRKYGHDEKRKVTEQLVLYRKGLSEPAHLQVMTLIKTKTPRIEIHRLLPEEFHVTEQELTEKFVMTQKAIESGVHYKSRGWQCNGCGMSHVCTAQQDTYEFEHHFNHRRVA